LFECYFHVWYISRPFVQDKLLIDKPYACVPDPVEPSEETRVALVSLLAELIRQADQGIAPYASDVAEIFKACARDQCPEALVATCQAAEALSHILVRRMQPVSHQMVRSQSEYNPDEIHRHDSLYPSR
jgi:hypothetical protein